MEKDAKKFFKKCHTCQIHRTLQHTYPTSLQDMTSPWPFHTWGLDLTRLIYPLARGNIWILTATKYFTKWVEATCMKKVIGAIVSKFLCEHTICRFGVPYKIITDNGTPFVNKHVNVTLSRYNIKHWRSAPYYRQGNGQAEVTNKVILKILSKIARVQGWLEYIPHRYPFGPTEFRQKN